MAQKNIDIPEIGPVIFKKSTKSRRLTIRIKALEGVQVSVPQSYTYAMGEAFVIQKKEWILKHLPKMQKMEENFSTFREDTDFRTRNHVLKILRHKDEKILLRIGKGETQILIPEHRNIEEGSIQEAIRFGIEKTWRKEALAYLPQRVAYFAQKHNFKYQKLSIKNTRTRWGSCSHQNNINLSLHLMRLPDELIDYVILHELCHTVEKNHGPGFWKLLDKVSGDARGLDKQMKKYQIKIY